MLVRSTDGVWVRADKRFYTRQVAILSGDKDVTLHSCFTWRRKFG